MKWGDFQRWFKSDYWKAFKHKTIPIALPKTATDREHLLRRVFDSVSSAKYAPSIPGAEMVINKGYGIARTVPVFCIEDYCVYYFCIKELEEVLCKNRTPNTFGGWRLGGDIRRMENSEIECELTEYGRYSFNPLAWVEAFGEFNSLLFSQLDAGGYDYVLQFDLSNFYDSVRLDILERWIREDANSKKGWIIALLFYFLNQWNRRNTGLHPQVVGLPQDALADCSRILSNYYLQKYDKFAKVVCDKAGVVYFRYADDQMLLLKNQDIAPNILLLLTRCLDQYGLRVNQKKTHIWQTSDFIKYRCRSIHEIFKNKGDNKNREKVRRFAEAFLSLEKGQLERTWNGGTPILNRLLWADLDTLPKSLFNKITGRLISKEFLLKSDYKKLVRIDEFNNKRSKPKSLDKMLIKYGMESVHNAFHYEVLAYADSKRKTKIKKLFKKRLDSINGQMKGHEIA